MLSNGPGTVRSGSSQSKPDTAAKNKNQPAFRFENQKDAKMVRSSGMILIWQLKARNIPQCAGRLMTHVSRHDEKHHHHGSVFP